MSKEISYQGYSMFPLIFCKDIIMLQWNIDADGLKWIYTLKKGCYLGFWLCVKSIYRKWQLHSINHAINCNLHDLAKDCPIDDDANFLTNCVCVCVCGGGCYNIKSAMYNLQVHSIWTFYSISSTSYSLINTFIHIYSYNNAMGVNIMLANMLLLGEGCHNIKSAMYNLQVYSFWTFYLITSTFWTS